MKHEHMFGCPFVVGIILLTLCACGTVRSQNTTEINNPRPSNSSNVDVFTLLNNLDIGKLISGMQQDGTLVDIANMVAATSTDYPIDEACMTDVLLLIQGVLNRNMWALQMLDAIGKPHSGLLYNFDLNWLGAFDECISVTALTYSNDTLRTDPVHHFDGKYCRIGLPVPTALMDVDPTFGQMTPHIKIGVCVPDTCRTEDMKHIITLVGRSVFNTTEEFVPDVECQDEESLPTRTIAAICVMSVIGLIAVIGTLYDIGLRLNKTPDAMEPEHGLTPQSITNGDLHTDVKVDLSLVNGENDIVDVKTTNNDVKTTTIGDLAPENRQPELPTRRQHSALEKMFLSFSVYSNGIKILSTYQPKGAVTCINGIRFFSMTWVILGHSVTFDAKNAIPYYMNTKVWQWTFYGIASATVSVDTFFTLSGVLVAYLTLRELSKRGGAKKMNWFMFYFHRYWRLTPAYMLSLMVYACLVRYFLDGPKWPKDNPTGDNCAINWWTNLLYINNYVGVDHMCFDWSWYLSNDMQFYILSPLIVVPLYYNAKVGGVVASVFLGITTAARAVISKQHEYTALLGGFIGPKPKDQDYMKNLYLPAHTRMGPYIVGLVTGYLLYRYKNTFKMKRSWNLLGWFSCMSIIILVLYGVYPDNGDHFLTVNESVAYMTLHRTAWALAVCWIIVACTTGHGGWINDFLSWSPFVPLGRLSYCAYLVHLICNGLYLASKRQSMYMTDFELIYFFAGTVLLSYLAAFGTSLLFEAPMMGLEKILFKRK